MFITKVVGLGGGWIVGGLLIVCWGYLRVVFLYSFKVYWSVKSFLMFVDSLWFVFVIVPFLFCLFVFVCLNVVGVCGFNWMQR